MHGVPKLRKFVEAISNRIKAIEGLKIKAFDVDEGDDHKGGDDEDKENMAPNNQAKDQD